MKKRVVLLLLATAFYSLSIAQNEQGSLQGKVTDFVTSEAIPFANVAVKKEGILISGATSDFKGIFYLHNLNEGKYDVQISYIGFKSKSITGVEIKAADTTTITVKLEQASECLSEVEVITYRTPLISKDGGSRGCTIQSEEIQKIPGRSPSSVRNTVFAGKRRKNNSTSSYNREVVYNRLNSSYTNNESYSTIVENEFKPSLDVPLSTFSIDVDAASYANVRRMINQGYTPPVDAVRIEEMVNYFSYDYPNPEGEHPFSITTEVANCPWNEKNKLVHIGLQGKKIETDNLPPNNLVFLIDVSGSMSSMNKLPLLKKSFSLLVDQLREEDHVAIVVYAGAAGCVLESTSGSEKDKILASLDKLQSGGSTAGGAGIKLAYDIARKNFKKDGNNRVILATDGDFNVGLSNDSEMKTLIERKREYGIFLTALGFGMGNYKDSKLEIIADYGNGNYAYIDNIMEAKKVFVNELGATLFTIAKDVKIQVEFNPGKVAYYRLIGYENRTLATEDFNDDAKDAGELGAGHTVTALYEIVPVGVKSDIVPNIDPLKYQKLEKKKVLVESDELLTVKFRYKDPDRKQSKLIVQTLNDESSSFQDASDNFKFSASVAEFGLLLRNSKHKASSSYNQVIDLAKSARGKDEFGYRAEFIRLVEAIDLMAVK